MALNRALLYSGPVSSIQIGATPIYYTLDGVTITIETENLEINTDQIPGPTKIKKVYHKIIIAFKIPEQTLDLLKYALNQPDANISGSDMSIKNNERSAEGVTIGLPSVAGRIYSLAFYSCCFLGTTELSYKKDGQTAFEIRLQVIYDSSTSSYAFFSKGI